MDKINKRLIFYFIICVSLVIISTILGVTFRKNMYDIPCYDFKGHVMVDMKCNGFYYNPLFLIFDLIILVFYTTYSFLAVSKKR